MKLGDRAAEINALLGTRSDEMANLLDERGQVLVEAIAARSAAMTTERAISPRPSPGLSTNVPAISSTSSTRRVATSSMRSAAGAPNSARCSNSPPTPSPRRSRRAPAGQLAMSPLCISGCATRSSRFSTVCPAPTRRSMKCLTSPPRHSISIEGGLADRLRDFQSTMLSMADQTSGATDRVGDQVTTLRDLAAHVINDVGAMAARLEQQSSHLTKAVAVLGELQGRVDQALDERRSTLEALVATVSGKVEAMEELMQSFANVVEEKLTNAEAKARQTSGLLADNANTTAQAIADQFELIRATTGKERERTSGALKSAYEQAAAEISDLFGNATERFAEVAQEMRGMTAAVQQELEATRSALKRGLLEIPKETSDSDRRHAPRRRRTDPGTQRPGQHRHALRPLA